MFPHQKSCQILHIFAQYCTTCLSYHLSYSVFILYISNFTLRVDYLSQWERNRIFLHVCIYAEKLTIKILWILWTLWSADRLTLITVFILFPHPTPLHGLSGVKGNRIDLSWQADKSHKLESCHINANTDDLISVGQNWSELIIHFPVS